MIKIKTHDLTGVALDWAVAKCEGSVNIDASGLPWLPDESPNEYGEAVWFKPSTNWAQGGPIIEREFIELTTTNRSNEELWEAIFPGRGEDAVVQYGPTLLIAAMRCYVSTKLGDEIEIPKEIAPCNT
jgi:hypothetical protein